MRAKFLLLPAFLLVILGGCRTPTAPVQPQPPPISLRAYINVSSGCQQATVDFIEGLKAKYPRLALELIDFGDGGRGSERWQMSGNKCMTIELNGQSIVKYPYQGTVKAVIFKMPAGVLWNHEDLEEAVRAAMAGTLQPATEDEAAGVPQDAQKKIQELKAKRQALGASHGAAAAKGKTAKQAKDSPAAEGATAAPAEQAPPAAPLPASDAKRELKEQH